MSRVWLFAVAAICLLALAYVAYNYIRMKKMGEGTERMVKMSAINAVVFRQRLNSSTP